MQNAEQRVIPATHELCLAVAKATVRKPTSSGISIAMQVGDHLADRLADELMTMLIQVIPAAITDTISADLMPGADKIAEFLGMDRRTVYHLAQTGKIPVFRMGNTICARKSTILRWIAEQESRASGGTAGMS